MQKRREDLVRATVESLESPRENAARNHPPGEFFFWQARGSAEKLELEFKIESSTI